MNLKRKLLVTALPFAFCISGLAHAMTLKIAEIHPAGYPTVVAMENSARSWKPPPTARSNRACSPVAYSVPKRK